MQEMQKFSRKWRKLFCIFLLFMVCEKLTAQHIDSLAGGTNTSLRGLSVVNDQIVWASGSNGTVARSTDGGKTWKWIKVAGLEKNDFRDIEAFDELNAVIMSVGEPAYILKTHDGGNTWRLVFEDKRPGMFLDAMEFWNEKSGIVIGDPIDGKIFVARTFDGGESWRGLPEQNYPTAEKGEAMFAASGTNIRKLDADEACFVTGGTKSRLFIRSKKIDIPIVQGKESTGANSVAVLNFKKINGRPEIIVVGGDFAADTVSRENCAITRDGGRTWIIPKTPPHGYRSCVEWINSNTLIACGTSGVDISKDGGMNWSLISKESYHVCRKAKDGKSVFLAGNRGRIARLVW